MAKLGESQPGGRSSLRREAAKVSPRQPAKPSEDEHRHTLAIAVAKAMHVPVAKEKIDPDGHGDTDNGGDEYYAMNDNHCNCIAHSCGDDPPPFSTIYMIYIDDNIAIQ